MLRYTRLDNGDMAFPKRGTPPPDFANYERDGRDPYLFHPKFVPCRYRLTIVTMSECKKSRYVDWRCELKGINVNVPICQSCEVEPK